MAGGRPKLSPEDRHSEQINIPLKPSDLASLQDSADKAQTTITDFVRASALGHRFNVMQSHAPDFETMAELRRIGVNLNQIAKALNARQQALPASLVSTCDKLDVLLERWLLDDPSHHNRPQL
ncbi:plasmid mobilization protein [Epibacterium ulvae]|nr:plasmid mobilization relaxosome protein MobC [Epibacterium ulvae]